MTKDLVKIIAEYSKRPALFEEGTGNIWTEPYLSSQMLQAHLDTSHDGASREKNTMEHTINYLDGIFQPHGCILDLGCGPGLYAERLSERGHHVTGIDFSENSIRFAKKNAEEKGLDIQYEYADMLQLHYDNQFDAIMQVYGEINTFSDKNRDKIFAMALKALKADGVFVFDVSTPISRQAQGLTRNWFAENSGFWREGQHIVLEDGVSYDDNIWLDQYIVIDEQDIKVYRNWFHDYTADRIKEILLNAGFQEVEVFEHLYGQEAATVDWLTVVARK